MTVNILASRTYPAFRQSVIVAELLPPTLMGDYHLRRPPASSARGLGAASVPVRWGPGHRLRRTPYRPDTRTSTATRGRRSSARLRRYDAGSDQMTP